MELDKNDFDLLIDNEGDVHLQYKTTQEGSSLHCLCILEDEVIYSVINKDTVRSGHCSYAPKKLLPGAVLAAHHCAELCAETPSLIKDIIHTMFSLLTGYAVEGVLSDSCTSSNAVGQLDSETSQAGAAR